MAAQSGLLSRFGIEERGSTTRVEVVGGITTFMTMAYILFVNGAILSAAGLDPAQVLTVTALVAGVMTLAMGLYANYPFAIAPGLGLNAFVAFSLVLGEGLTPPQAMGVILVEGLIITALVLTGLREAILNAIPMALKKAIGVGIGLFIALIGFSNAGFVIHPEAGAPLLDLGQIGTARLVLFVLGLLLAFTLIARKVRGALLIAILGTTIVGIAVNELFYDGELWAAVGPNTGQIPSSFVAAPDFGLLGDVSLGFFTQMGILAAVIAIFSVMLSDFFDTVGTVVGLGDEAGFLRPDGTLPGMKKVLLVDSVAAVAGGAASSSSATTYIESAAGISEGARTGLASVVTGILFLLCLFIAPLAGVIPAEATATALVVVGFLMMGAVRDIDWGDVTVAAPAFLIIVGMPFTFSIADGIGMGFVAFALLKLYTGRAKEVHPMMWIASAAFLIYFALEPIKSLLNITPGA